MKTNTSQKIKQIRKDNNLTQQEFSEKMGVSRSYLSNVEAGKQEPSFSFLMLLLRAFKVDANWLLGLREERQTLVDGRRYDMAEAEEYIKEFRGWLERYWQRATPDRRWWLIVQLRRCIEEYDQHLSAPGTPTPIPGKNKK